MYFYCLFFQERKIREAVLWEGSARCFKSSWSFVSFVQVVKESEGKIWLGKVQVSGCFLSFFFSF